MDGVTSAIVILSQSFDAFVSKLLSEQEYDQKHSGTSEYEEFKVRLEALKQQRKEEVQDFLKNDRK